MATAGSEMFSQELSEVCLGDTPFESARDGVFLHGLAGDLAAKETGERYLIASDIISHLPSAFGYSE